MKSEIKTLLSLQIDLCENYLRESIVNLICVSRSALYGAAHRRQERTKKRNSFICLCLLCGFSRSLSRSL